MITGMPGEPATILEDPVYTAIAGRHFPAWHCPLRPALQHAAIPPPQAPPLGVQAAAVGAHAPLEMFPEQHFAALAEGMPATRQPTPLGGVAEAQAVNSVPSAQPEPL